MYRATESSRVKWLPAVSKGNQASITRREIARLTQQTSQTCKNNTCDQQLSGIGHGRRGQAYCKVWANALSLSTSGKLDGGGGAMGATVLD